MRNYTIVTTKNNLQTRYEILLFIILITIGVTAAIMLPRHENLNEWIFITPILICIVLILVVPGFVDRYRVIGNLKFHADNFEVTREASNKSINYRDINNLTFFLRGINGDSLSLRDGARIFFGRKDGAGNILETSTKNGTETIDILLRSRNDYRSLKFQLKELSDKGVPCSIEKEEYDQVVLKRQKMQRLISS